MAQGDDALARGDYEQALLIGNRIVSQDPPQFDGLSIGPYLLRDEKLGDGFLENY